MDEKYSHGIYYAVTGITLIFGLCTAIFMVKNVEIQRNYIKNEQGTYKRLKKKVINDFEQSDDDAPFKDDKRVLESSQSTYDFGDYSKEKLTVLT